MAENLGLRILISAKDKASKQIRGLRNRLNSLHGTVAKVGAAIGTYFAGKAVYDFFAGAVKTASDFEEQLSKVQAVTGSTSAEMDKMRKKAEEMGASTSFSATEAAEGLETLGRAGLSATEANASLESSLKLAEANTIKLGESAGIVADNLGRFQLEADQAGRVSDVLSRAARLANTTVSELSKGMQEAAPIANAMGMSLETTVGYMDAFAKAGIRGEKAGTGMKTILTQLRDPASEARKELRDLGVDTDDLGKVLEGLAENGGKKAEEAILAFGQEAGPRLEALLAQGDGAIQQLIADLNEAEGTSKKMAATAKDNLAGAVEQLSAAWEAFQIALGKNLIPVVRDNVEALTGTLREMAADGSLQTFAESVSNAMKQASAEVREFLAQYDFREAFKNLTTFVDGVTRTLTRLKAGFDLLAGTTRIAFNAITAGFRTVMAVVTGGVANLLRKLEQLANGLSYVGIISEGMANKVGDAASAAEDATKALRDQIVQDGKDMKAGLDQVASGAYNLGAAEESAAASAKKHGKAQKESAKDAAEASEDVDKLTKRYQDLLGSISSLGSGEEIQQVKDKLEVMLDAGQISAEQYDKALQAATARSEELANAADKAGNAAQEAGEKGETAMDKIANGAYDAAESFRGLANALATAETEKQLQTITDKARELYEQGKIGQEQLIAVTGRANEKTQQLSETMGEVTKAIGGVATSQEAELLKQKFKEMFKQGELSAKQYQEALDELEKKMGESADGQDKATEATKRSTESQKEAEKQVEKTGEQAKESAQETRQFAEELSALGGSIAGIFNGWSKQLAGLSQKASDTFSSMQGFTTPVRDEMERLEQKSSEAQKALQDAVASPGNLAGGVGSYLQDMAIDAAKVKREYYEQAKAAKALENQIRETGGASLVTGQSAEEAVQQFDMLGSERLGPLRSAIKDAKREVQSLRDETSSVVTDLKNELDRMNDNQEAVQKREYERRKAELKKQLKEAKELGDQAAISQAQEALRLQEKVHREKMKDLREEKEAESEADTSDIDERERRSEEAHQNELKRIEEEKTARERIAEQVGMTKDEFNKWVHDREMQRVDEE